MPRPFRTLLWIVLVLIVVGVIGAIVGGSAWIKAYLRSDNFRALVAEKTGLALQSNVTYTPLNWSGDSVFTDRLSATGVAGSPVATLQADQVRASVNWRAMMQGAWRVDEIEAGYVEGTFHQGTPSAADTAAIAAVPAPPPSGLWRWLPQRFELGSLNIAQCRINYTDPMGHEVASLRDSALTLRPDGDQWVVAGVRGTLNALGLPALTVDSFHSRFQQTALFLTDAQLRLGESGQISLSGQLADKSQLLAQWQQVDLANFLNDFWKARLSGMTSGDATVQWSSESPATATGHFSLTDGLLQNMPLLEQIAAFTGAPQFRRMPLQAVTADYSWAGGRLTLTNFAAESKGLMRLEGNCVVGVDRTVQGTMRLGVTPQTLQWLPGSRERVFTVEQDGYLWTDVQVSGNLDDIRENLSERLVRAMGNEAIQRGAKLLDEALPGTGGDAQKALQLLSPLLR